MLPGALSADLGEQERTTSRQTAAGIPAAQQRDRDGPYRRSGVGGGADAAMKRITLSLGVLVLTGCGIHGSSPCKDGGNSCAAAHAPPGMRQVLKGHRFVRARWVERTNKESGIPDIGMEAEWAPITETR